MTEREFLLQRRAVAVAKLRRAADETQAALGETLEVKRWFRQFPKATIGVAAGGAALVGGWIFWTFFHRRPPRRQFVRVAQSAPRKIPRMVLRLLLPLKNVLISAVTAQVVQLLGGETAGPPARVRRGAPSRATVAVGQDA